MILPPPLSSSKAYYSTAYTCSIKLSPSFSAFAETSLCLVVDFLCPSAVVLARPSLVIWVQLGTDMNFEYGGGRLLRIVDRGHGLGPSAGRNDISFMAEWQWDGISNGDSCSQGEFYSNVYFAMFVDLIFANKCDACIVSTEPNSTRVIQI